MATFDTLAAARTLEGAGMDPAQAAAATETIRSAATELSRRDEPVTRGDLAVLAAKIHAEIAGLRSEIAALESRLLWRLLGGGGALLLLSRLADFLA